MPQADQTARKARDTTRADSVATRTDTPDSAGGEGDGRRPAPRRPDAQRGARGEVPTWTRAGDGQDRILRSVHGRSGCGPDVPPCGAADPTRLAPDVPRARARQDIRQSRAATDRGCLP